MQRRTDPSRLVDLADLTHLVCRYAEALDRRDMPSLLGCFTAAGQLELNPPAGSQVVLTGHSEIEEYVRTRFFRGPDGLLAPDVRSTHLMGVPLARFEEGAWALRTKAVIYLASERVGIHVRGVEYTDRCVQEDGSWLFAHRRHELQWSSTIPLAMPPPVPAPVEPPRYG